MTEQARATVRLYDLPTETSVRSNIRRASAAFLIAITCPVYAQVGGDGEDIGHYIERVYGSGNEYSDAASAYATALDTLWTRAANTQQYDSELTDTAQHAQYCLQAKLERVEPRRAQSLLVELKRKLASTPARYAGYLFAEQLAAQHPVVAQMSEARECELTGVEPSSSRSSGQGSR